MNARLRRVIGCGVLVFVVGCGGPATPAPTQAPARPATASPTPPPTLAPTLAPTLVPTAVATAGPAESLKVNSTTTADGVTTTDLTFGGTQPTDAYLVGPASAVAGSTAGIVWFHWS